MASQPGRTAIASTAVARRGRRWAGFASQGEALQALQVALARLHRRNGRLAQITVSELAEEHLA
jgi:hypothetical protein